MPVHNHVSMATMTVEASKLLKNSYTANTSRIYSVDEISVKAMDADFARLVGSRVAGVATKAVLADQLRQKDELLGAVAWVAMNLSDRADLRQWSTLPQSFQIARAPVPAGKHMITLKAVGSSAEKKVEVEVKPGRKAFVVWRVLE